MKIQIPAEGILQRNDWGNAKVYRIDCECGADDHNHNLWVEAEDTGVTVTVYTTVKTNWYSKTRWQHIWTLLTKGYIDTESVITMTQQQAFNYAHTLLSAIDDTQKFRDERKEKSATAKLSEQGDCV